MIRRITVVHGSATITCAVRLSMISRRKPAPLCISRLIFHAEGQPVALTASGLCSRMLRGSPASPYEGELSIFFGVDMILT